MDIHTAEQLAIRLMTEHGLSDWEFRFDRARRRFGLCSSHRKLITLSKPLVELNPEIEVKNVILHEIAHALVGTNEGHNLKWKRKAKEIGCTGERCYNAEVVNKPKPKYRGICPGGHNHTRNRKSKYVASCSLCCPYYNTDYLITWELND